MIKHATIIIIVGEIILKIPSFVSFLVHSAQFTFPLDAVIYRQDLSSGVTSMKDVKKRKERLSKSSSEFSPSILVSKKTKFSDKNKTSPEGLSQTNLELL